MSNELTTQNRLKALEIAAMVSPSKDMDKIQALAEQYYAWASTHAPTADIYKAASEAVALHLRTEEMNRDISRRITLSDKNR